MMLLKKTTLLTTFTLAIFAMSALAVPDAHAEHAAWRSGPFAPLPELPDLDPGKVRLGEQLFHDTRLSADDTVSCATCHDLNHGGVDGRETALGIDGQEGPINTPTVFNSAYNFSQFCDGRAEHLEQHAAGPVHQPAERGYDCADATPSLAGRHK